MEISYISVMHKIHVYAHEVEPICIHTYMCGKS